jgi:hypothetical protein
VRNKYLSLSEPKVNSKNRRDAWKLLPYGTGLTDSGDTIIFDRWYSPLLRVTPDGRAATCAEAIEVADVRWLYTDNCPPHRDAETRRRISEMIERVPGLLAAVEARRATRH